ncbi:MAG: hypothetical protein AAF487_09495 [Bacteroidota bacterium]
MRNPWNYFLLFLISSFVLASCEKDEVDDEENPLPVSHVAYGSEDRQWLNLYLADSNVPTPVYFFSHSNGATADDVQGFVADLQEAGISTISWESELIIDSFEDIETCWADAELMIQWVKNNAEQYNLDMNNLLIGGRSRGSIASWKLAHSQEDSIRGIYMFQALPDGAWGNLDEWNPTEDISALSADIKLTYKLEPGTVDIHDPENGALILSRYEELGIEENSSLSHSLGSDPQLYADISEWCLGRIQ